MPTKEAPLSQALGAWLVQDPWTVGVVPWRSFETRSIEPSSSFEFPAELNAGGFFVPTIPGAPKSHPILLPSSSNRFLSSALLTDFQSDKSPVTFSKHAAGHR